MKYKKKAGLHISLVERDGEGRVDGQPRESNDEEDESISEGWGDNSNWNKEESKHTDGIGAQTVGPFTSSRCPIQNRDQNPDILSWRKLAQKDSLHTRGPSINYSGYNLGISHRVEWYTDRTRQTIWILKADCQDH